MGIISSERGEQGPAGPPGPPGGGGGTDLEDLSVVAFAFDEASPIAVEALLSGSDVEHVQIVIDTPFNDAAASLSCGLSAAPALFLLIPSPTALAQYESDELYAVPSDDTLILTIHAASSSQGAGRLLYRVKKP